MKKVSYKLLLLGICILFNSLSSYGQTFGLEQDFSNPALLPNSVYKILLKNKDINDTIKEERNNGKSIKSIKKRFFDVTKVSINDDKFLDLLVKAKSFLSGMNTTRYWIFKKTSKGYVLVFETATFSLNILKNKSKGHRIIEAAYPSGSKAYTTYFRFDGKKYVFSWSREEDI
jgi:hypothetical protein